VTILFERSREIERYSIIWKRDMRIFPDSRVKDVTVCRLITQSYFLIFLYVALLILSRFLNTLL